MEQPEPEPEPEPEPYADDGVVQWEVCGHTLRMQQQQLAGGASDGTGWRMWNSALVLAKYIEANAPALLQPRLRRPPGVGGDAAATAAAAPVRVLDMSAGPGLLGLACAVCGATHGLAVEVVLTEMPSESLTQLQANVAAANAQLSATLGAAYRPVSAAAFTWGESPSGAAAAAFADGFDVVLVSDCLFIAVRDDLYSELRAAMTTVCTPPPSATPTEQQASTLMLFAYEERCDDEERGFLAELEAPGQAPPFACEEVAAEELDLECTLDDGELGDLFAEVAPVRILRLQRCAQE